MFGEDVTLDEGNEILEAPPPGKNATKEPDKSAVVLSSVPIKRAGVIETSPLVIINGISSRF